MKYLSGTLSGGEQQMLAIARAIIHHPVLLICDELSLGLAPLVVQTVFESLAKLKDLGTTILVVEQFATKVFEIASRGYIMNLGSISAQGDSQTLATDDKIRKSYLT
jgi:branched-chain amino acid transport system ATP-binding protein